MKTQSHGNAFRIDSTFWEEVGMDRRIDGFPTQKALMRKCYVFFVVSLNKLIIQQLRGTAVLH